MKTRYTALALAGSLVVLAGCSTTNATGGDSAAVQSQLEDAQARAQQSAAEAERLRTELSSARTAGTSAADLLPPNAEPGHCYARVLIPAQYESGSETVLASAASQRIEIIPARYDYVDETVMVEEESTRLGTEG